VKGCKYRVFPPVAGGFAKAVAISILCSLPKPIMDSNFPMAVERHFIVLIPSTDSYFPLILEEEEIGIDHVYALSI
jgi:hypothetical protein